MISSKDKTQEAFFALLQAGLWEKSVRLSPFSPIDFDALYKLAEEQSVIGLIAAGLEHIEDMTLSKQQVMPFMKQVISLEHRNASMNIFLGSLFEKMRSAGIKALLVKGQGIAQCYERPLWRAAGDVDLLFDAETYEKAKLFLTPLASVVDDEDADRKHLGMTIDSWTVELHGTLHFSLSKAANQQIDFTQEHVFEANDVRVWNNDGIDVHLPSPNSDVIFIFAHILQHFFRGGIGLRQICDWCRLLWTFRDDIDHHLLEERIRIMKVMTEWKSFSAYAVKYLGMPVEAMPMYDSDSCWERKARRINSFILEVGYFGHNRDRNYYKKYPYFIYKLISFRRHLSDFFRHLIIFPKDSIVVFGKVLSLGVNVMSKGE